MAGSAAKRYDEALTDLRKALQLNPHPAHWWKRLGAIECHLKKYDKAIVSFRKAIEIKPSDYSNLFWIDYIALADCQDQAFRQEYLKLADLSIELNRQRGLTSHAVRAVILTPYEEDAAADKDFALALEGLPSLTLEPEAELKSLPSYENSSSRHDFREVAYTCSLAANVLEHRGHLDQSRRRRRQAIDRSRQLATQYPEDTDLKNRLVSYQLALVALELKTDHKSGTMDVLRQVLETSSEGYYPRYQLALIQLAANECDSYRKANSTMLKQFADSTLANELHFTAWTCVLAADAVDDYSLAVQLAERAFNANPKDASLQQCLGALLFRAGRFNDALEHLNKAAESDENKRTSPAYGWYFLAMTHHKLGQQAARGQAAAGEGEGAPPLRWSAEPAWGDPRPPVERDAEQAWHRKEARTWFDKAVEWTERVLDENREDHEPVSCSRRLTLELLRSEAAEMLRPFAAVAPKLGQRISPDRVGSQLPGA